MSTTTKQFRTVFAGIILSILVFFSISFITVLTQISPFHYYRGQETYKLGIGFPFTYYEQFWLRGNEVPHSGWSGNHLIYDCMITWVAVTGLYYFIQNRKTTTMKC